MGSWFEADRALTRSTSQRISSHWRLDFSVAIGPSEWEHGYKSRDRTGAQEELMKSLEKQNSRCDRPPQRDAHLQDRVYRMMGDSGTNQVLIKRTSAQRRSRMVQLRTFIRFIRQPSFFFFKLWLGLSSPSSFDSSSSRKRDWNALKNLTPSLLSPSRPRRKAGALCHAVWSPDGWCVYGPFKIEG